MAWSTRELANLTGTTINTIRHYHRLGLLAEPERRYNGYKKYGVTDLVRLMRIRRLTDLGMPLAQISEVDADGDAAPETLRRLDAEIAATIQGLERARADIAAILDGDAPADSPAGFAPVAAGLSEADRSLLHLYSSVYDEETMADFRRMVEADPTRGDLDALPEDADEETRLRLVERMAPVIAQNLADYPWLADPTTRLRKGGQVTAATFVEAVSELYNKAQLDVLTRASFRAQELHVSRGGPAGGAVAP